MTDHAPVGRSRCHRVMIVDDHPLMRRGLRELFEREPGLEVCGEAESVAGALDEIDGASPDLVIIDLTLKDGSGLALVEAIRDRDPSVATLIWSMHDESLFAERALRTGAMGYVSKAASADELVAAVRDVLGGRVAVSPAVAQRLLQTVGRGGAKTMSGGVLSLSNRELAVFELIGNGLTTRQIAERLQLSVKTIDSHRENIKAKLGLDSAIDLVRHAVLWVLEEA
ncbi:MAG TPA: response regulator transcription factor [Candidatus Sulfomarinibacteraceae bacterium]|nr:response regulator transcription factor [Candidatus Sulfomarinibacteraceae bacterium]